MMSVALLFCLLSSVPAVCVESASTETKVATESSAKPCCGVVSKVKKVAKDGASSANYIVNSVYSWALQNRVITASGIAALVFYAIYSDEVNAKIKNTFSSDDANRCGCNKPKPKPAPSQLQEVA